MAPLTVVTARRVSLPGVYFSTVVLSTNNFGTSLALWSPLAEHLLELLCLFQFLHEILVNRDLEGIGEIKVPRVNLVDLNAPVCGGSPAPTRISPSHFGRAAPGRQTIARTRSHKRSINRSYLFSYLTSAALCFD